MIIIQWQISQKAIIITIIIFVNEYSSSKKFSTFILEKKVGT